MSENIVATHYEVDPVMVCGGVYVDGKGFVEVNPGKEHRESENGLSIWEYTDPEGDVRACMLRVDNQRTSPRWHIKPDVCDSAYYELHRTVSGLGTMIVEQSGEVQYEAALPGGIDCQPLRVEPDNIFSIRAENGASEAATYVIATFPGAPFKLEYEERV